MKKPLLVMTAGVLALVANAALASTASQREYKRGFADCSAGRCDQEQHGVSYKKGCDAAEAKGKSGAGAATAEPTEPKPYMDPSVPGKDKQACIRAVKKQTHNPKAVVIGAVSSEANNQVTVGVGSERAPWKCLVKRGKVAEVTSQTNEGGL